MRSVPCFLHVREGRGGGEERREEKEEGEKRRGGRKEKINVLERLIRVTLDL